MEKSSEIPKAAMSKTVSKPISPLPKLFQHTHKEIDMFYTKDIKEERAFKNKCVLDLIASETARDFLKFNKEYEELIEIYAKKNNLERIAILLAHGDEVDNTWCYYNGDKAFSVQNWINNMDGKYKALILYSCNPGGNEITSIKSPVLVSNKEYSHALLLKGRVQIELFLPGSGYVDSYMIEEELKNLKK